MHVLYLNYFYDRFFKTESDLLEKYSNMIRWCSAVKLAGANEVSVIQRFHRNAEFELDGVCIYLLSDEFHNKLSPFDNPKLIHDHIVKLRPDVIHHNGWTYPLLFLRPQLPNTTSITWQHHGGGLPQWYSRWHYKSGFKAVDACLFTSTELSKSWKKLNIIENHIPIYEIVESSTNLRLLPQEQSRKKLNISGNPIFLWVGRLNKNKDPLTVLQSILGFIKDYPRAKLYMIYHENQLLKDVESYITTNRLSENVILIGQVPHEILEDYFNAADYYLSSSFMEGSGFALIEAIACGCAPIVTNIPPFRQITNAGEVGILWHRGDSNELAKAILSISQNPPSRQTVRMYFEKHLSFDVLGKIALNVYINAWSRRNNMKNDDKILSLKVKSNILQEAQK